MPSDDLAAMSPGDMSPDELRGEVERLRALVGPTEVSYLELRDQLLTTRDAACGAEQAAGKLRGRIAEMNVELRRARQDQEQVRRTMFRLPVKVLRRIGVVSR